MSWAPGGLRDLVEDGNIARPPWTAWFPAAKVAPTKDAELVAALRGQGGWSGQGAGAHFLGL